MSKIYVTMGNDTPVKAYLNENMAKDAVSKSAAAKKQYYELWNSKVEMYNPGVVSSMRVQSDRYPYDGGDGYFYKTKEMALYAKKKTEFYKSEDVLACQKANTGEEYYVVVDLVE